MTSVKSMFSMAIIVMDISSHIIKESDMYVSGQR